MNLFNLFKRISPIYTPEELVKQIKNKFNPNAMDFNKLVELYPEMDGHRNKVNAMYHPIEDVIVSVIVDLDTSAYLFFHEFFHWTGHPSRLNRGVISKIANRKIMNIDDFEEQYHTEELSVEKAIMMFYKANGLDIEKSKARIAIYWRMYPKADPVKSDRMAREMCDWTLNKLRERKVA